MPHAENGSTTSPDTSTSDTMTERMTNGDKPNSQFICHLTSYPVVSDSISVYKSNPYGAKSLSIASDVYEKLFTSVQPYLQGPYSYVAPYVAKADTLGEIGLEKIDSKFPIVKEETAALKEKVTGVAFLPLTLGAQGKDYVFTTYSEQRQNTGVEEKGLVSKFLASGMAVFYTEYKIATDAAQVLASFLSQKKQEGKKFADSN